MQNVQPSFSGITVNGESLECYLAAKTISEIEGIQQSEVKRFALLKRKPLPVCGIKQEYDETPGACKQFNRTEIVMENLKPIFEAKINELVEEAKSSNPNRTKLVIAALCGGDFLSCSQLSEKIESHGKALAPSNAIAGIFTVLMKPEQNKPLRKLIEKNRIDGKIVYRLFPPAAKISLSNLHQLSMKKGVGHYSMKDAIREVPEIGTYLALSDDKKSAPEDEMKAAPAPEDQPAANLSPLTAGNQNFNLNVRVDFGAIRVLFGIER